MAYFRNFSEFLYQSPLPSRNSSYDYVKVKNIFRRAKIREDIFQAAVAFDKYTITEGERPDEIADAIYGSPEFDWVVLLSNNIINYRTEWPLSDYEFNKYIEAKYTAAELGEVHHYETTDVFDDRNNLIVPRGKIVDQDFSVTYFDYDLITKNTIAEGITMDTSTVTYDSTTITFDSTVQVEEIQGREVTVNPVRSISVYEYEIDLNEKKRSIYVLKPRYLQTIIDDLEDIMNYRFSSQFIDRKTKKGDELRLISPR